MNYEPKMLRLKEVPRKVWNCSNGQLFDALQTILCNSRDIACFIKELIAETVAKLETKDFIRDNRLKLLYVAENFWCEEVPSAADKLLKDLCEFKLTTSQTDKLFILDLTIPESKYCYLPEINYIHLLEDILYDFSSTTNCEYRIDMIARKCAIVPMLETVIERVIEEVK